MDKASPRPQSPGAENLSRQASKILSTQFCHRHQLLHHAAGSDLSARVLKKLSGETKGRIWLDCCHGLRRKAVNAVNVVNSARIWIYPRRSDPFIGKWKPTTTLSSQSFHQSCSLWFHLAKLTSDWFNSRILDFFSNIFYNYLLSLQSAIYCLKMCISLILLSWNVWLIWLCVFMGLRFYISETKTRQLDIYNLAR